MKRINGIAKRDAIREKTGNNHSIDLFTIVIAFSFFDPSKAENHITNANIVDHNVKAGNLFSRHHYHLGGRAIPSWTPS